MEEMIGGGGEDLLAKTDKDIAINSGETNPEATVEPVASDNIIAEDAESDAKVAGVEVEAVMESISDGLAVADQIFEDIAKTDEVLTPVPIKEEGTENVKIVDPTPSESDVDRVIVAAEISNGIAAESFGIALEEGFGDKIKSMAGTAGDKVKEAGKYLYELLMKVINWVSDQTRNLINMAKTQITKFIAARKTNPKDIEKLKEQIKSLQSTSNSYDDKQIAKISNMFRGILASAKLIDNQPIVTVSKLIEYIKNNAMSAGKNDRILRAFDGLIATISTISKLPPESLGENNILMIVKPIANIDQIKEDTARVDRTGFLDQKYKNTNLLIGNDVTGLEIIPFGPRPASHNESFATSIHKVKLVGVEDIYKKDGVPVSELSSLCDILLLFSKKIEGDLSKMSQKLEQIDGLIKTFRDIKVESVSDEKDKQNFAKQKLTFLGNLVSMTSLLISKTIKRDTELFANTKTLIEESIKLHNKSGTAAKAEDKKEEEPKKEGDNKTGEAGEQKE